MPKEKTLLFSLTKKDFEVQTFCTGGPGGQHKNAKQNGVRIIHKASGAVAEHRDGHDQAKNKMTAFVKLTESKKFRDWHKAEVAKHLRQEAGDILEEIIAEKVNKAMAEKNLKVETYVTQEYIDQLVADSDRSCRCDGGNTMGCTACCAERELKCLQLEGKIKVNRLSYAPVNS